MVHWVRVSWSNPELTSKASLTSQLSLGILRVCLLRVQLQWTTRSLQYFFSFSFFFCCLWSWTPGVMLTWQHCNYWVVSLASSNISFMWKSKYCLPRLQVLLLLLVSALNVEPELVLNSLASTPSLFSAGMTGVSTEYHFSHLIGGESHS